MEVLHGERIVRLLEKGGIKLSVALWLLTEEYSDWRFVVASKNLDPLTPFAQVKTTQDILRRTLSVEQIPTLRIMKTQDPFPRDLRKRFGKIKHVEGMRLAGQFIGNRFVEDGYLYRLQ
jgi:hypothetical protein